MKATKQVLLFLSGICASVSAEAVGPTATASFYIEDRETHKRSPASQARLGQYVCVSIRANAGPGRCPHHAIDDLRRRRQGNTQGH